MTTTVYLHHWSGNGPAVMTEGERPRAAILPLYTLEQCDLRRYNSILIPAHVDQRYLVTQQSRLETFLQEGGTIVVNGHIAYPFLRWLQPFEALMYNGLDSLRIHHAQPHPIFDGVDPEDMTFRRGVAGFYARGSNPVSAGAVVLNTIGPVATPIDWLLTLPGGGRLLVHSGNDLWMFHDSEDSTALIVPQLFAWLEKEAL